MYLWKLQGCQIQASNCCWCWLEACLKFRAKSRSSVDLVSLDLALLWSDVLWCGVAWLVFVSSGTCVASALFSIVISEDTRSLTHPVLHTHNCKHTTANTQPQTHRCSLLCFSARSTVLTRSKA